MVVQVRLQQPDPGQRLCQQINSAVQHERCPRPWAAEGNFDVLHAGLSVQKSSRKVWRLLCARQTAPTDRNYSPRE